MRKDDDTYFYHYDGLGSVRQLTGKEKIICPIATAVYGTPMAEEVNPVRKDGAFIPPFL